MVAVAGARPAADDRADFGGWSVLAAVRSRPDHRAAVCADYRLLDRPGFAGTDPGSLDSGRRMARRLAGGVRHRGGHRCGVHHRSQRLHALRCNQISDGRQIIGNLVTPQRVQSLAASGRADYNGNMISQRFVQEFTVMQPAATLARRPIPTLLVQAGKDMSVHPSQVEIYEQALQEKAARVGKFLLADADHIFSSIAWERKVIEQTVKWFGQVL